MNKKKTLWLIVALAVVALTGWMGVRTAIQARERSAEFLSSAESLISGAFGTSSASGPRPTEPYLAKLKVEGTIMDNGGTSSLTASGSYNHDFLLESVKDLIEDENNVGMLLYIDSPGGEMNAGDELYLRLMDYKATGRPIYCYFDSLACSGGYYVAMASDEIYANRNCLCVNIGVYMAAYNFSGLFEKLGVEQVAFKSSENKGIGMSGVPWTDEQKEIYQSIVDESYDQFLEVVAEGRGMTKDRVRELDDGREMTARQALKAGFIDGICRYEEYEQDVLSRAGTDVLYEIEPATSPVYSLFNFIESVAPRSDTQELTRFAKEHGRLVVMAYADN